ncbi:MAG: hypothetical protein AAFN63_11345 [Pseudomonadota bacterium]
MIGKRIDSLEMARHACRGMPEEHRLALATELLNSATSPNSQRQLKCAETAAREARLALSRDEDVQRATA